MDEIEPIKIRVVGEQSMHCSGCERIIKFTRSQLPSVRLVQADNKTQMIAVDLASGSIDMENVDAALDQIGYEVQIV